MAMTSLSIEQRIQFVLVETSHPGNIGAVARAIKTMGFGKLVLVNPRSFPDPEATTRASGADDVLQNAKVVASLDEALASSELVVGTSVRDRQIAWPIHNPRTTALKIKNHIVEQDQESTGEVSILFGRERTGLENSELDKASWQVRIPANDEYNSLNLASATQIIAYELRCALLEPHQPQNQEQEDAVVQEVEVDTQTEEEAASKLQQRQRLASHAEMQSYYQHLEEVLAKLDFLKVSPPTKLLRKIQRLYNRSHVSFEELQILRGILTAIDKKLKS